MQTCRRKKPLKAMVEVELSIDDGEHEEEVGSYKVALDRDLGKMFNSVDNIELRKLISKILKSSSLNAKLEEIFHIETYEQSITIDGVADNNVEFSVLMHFEIKEEPELTISDIIYAYSEWKESKYLIVFNSWDGPEDSFVMGRPNKKEAMQTYESFITKKGLAGEWEISLIKLNNNSFVAGHHSDAICIGNAEVIIAQNYMGV